MNPERLRRAVAGEAIGTAFLLMAIVGSGIMAARLSGEIAALALLCNSLATAAALAVITVVLQPVSGAHLNPVMTLAAALRREMTTAAAMAFIAAQMAGALVGVAAAHAMFELAPVQIATTRHSGWGQALAEAVATFGLVLVVRGVRRPAAIPLTVGAYIGAAYWFTASTSFANPAATIARGFTDTFAGIAPADVTAFIAAQLAGALAALALLGRTPALPPPAAIDARSLPIRVP